VQAKVPQYSSNAKYNLLLSKENNIKFLIKTNKIVENNLK